MNSSISESISFRKGTSSDMQMIQDFVLKEKMNPMSLVPERFSIAQDASG
eukprot:CAMPEP_0202905620 /NCGR_PEP_ID=MMETSP1392-20130828/35306_1 /ASSEMBLY_ACC=CAM_ASM_000868 /TAXON_ID=225041 /ORGANISM="Chlamydomonas chlamydogama, Strain SAG 11-48b" /LENGTH=49 /DNA_ID= /DNA_START= /DNA_END= /DNA_ORIENTATION=